MPKSSVIQAPGATAQCPLEACNQHHERWYDDDNGDASRPHEFGGSSIQHGAGDDFVYWATYTETRTAAGTRWTGPTVGFEACEELSLEHAHILTTALAAFVDCLDTIELPS